MSGNMRYCKYATEQTFGDTICPRTTSPDWFSNSKGGRMSTSLRAIDLDPKDFEMADYDNVTIVLPKNRLFLLKTLMLSFLNTC